MAQGVNKVILLGRVGKDPKIMATANGLHVATFSIATSESWKDKNSGEKQEKVEWHNCVAFGKTAELIKQYVAQGSLMYAEGKLTTSKYEDKNTGEQKYSTKVSVEHIQLLNQGKKDNAPATTQPAHPNLDQNGFDVDVPF